MTLEALKSEAQKLGKLELLDFAQFIIESIKDKENNHTPDFQLSKPQKMEVNRRLQDIESDLSSFISGVEAEEQLIKKYGLEV